eukprot:7705911-Pyramimonas_sp.AAC.1
MGFSEHAVARENPARTASAGYFSDGVPWSKRDTFVISYMSNTMTKQRFTICAVRKQDVCKCGCHGQCAFGQISRALAWSFNAMATGVWPGINHQNLPLDEERALKRGFDLAGGWRAAVTEIRCDLLELTSAF